MADVRPRLEVGIDCRDPEALVRFWTAALGYVRGSGNGQPYIDLCHPDGCDEALVVFLQRVPEPKQVKNRLHIDLYVAEPQPLVDRLVGLGGTTLGPPVQQGDGWFQVMADPEGNELCVCAETD
jgi:predicted enzyme related to lactoylglutathione lyase